MKLEILRDVKFGGKKHKKGAVVDVKDENQIGILVAGGSAQAFKEKKKPAPAEPAEEQKPSEPAPAPADAEKSE